MHKKGMLAHLVNIPFCVLGRNRRVPSLQSLLKWIPSHILIVVDKLVHPNLPQEPLEDASPVPKKQRRPSLLNPQFKIPRVEWANVLHRIEQGESLRQIAKNYGVSYESVRRVVRAARHKISEN